MNWTGGRLQRHSKNNASTVSNRQKQHFARVRTQLQNPGAVPFTPGFLLDPHERIGTQHVPLVQNKGRDGGLARPRKMTKDAHSFVPEVTRALSQPTIWPKCRKIANPAKRHAHPAGRHSAERSPRFKGSQRSQPRHALDARLTEDTPLHVTKTRHGAPSAGGFEDAKDKLLHQSDWVGLLPSRPLQMHFSSDRAKARVGKRRKVSVSAQHGPVDSADARQPPFLRPQEMDLAAGNQHQDEIRVCIGPDAVASSFAGHHPNSRTRTHPPDSMLLDAERAAASPPAEIMQSDIAGSSYIVDQAYNGYDYREADMSQNANETYSPDAECVRSQKMDQAQWNRRDFVDIPLRLLAQKHVTDNVTRWERPLHRAYCDLDPSYAAMTRPPSQQIRINAQNPVEDFAVYAASREAVPDDNTDQPWDKQGQVSVPDDISPHWKALLALHTDPASTSLEDPQQGRSSWGSPQSPPPQSSVPTSPHPFVRNTVSLIDASDTLQQEITRHVTMGAAGSPSLRRIMDQNGRTTALQQPQGEDSDKLWRKFVFPDEVSAISDAMSKDDDQDSHTGSVNPLPSDRDNAPRPFLSSCDAVAPSSTRRSMLHYVDIHHHDLDKSRDKDNHEPHRAFALSEATSSHEEVAPNVPGSESMYNHPSHTDAPFAPENRSSPIVSNNAAEKRPVKLPFSSNLFASSTSAESVVYPKKNSKGLERRHGLFSKPRAFAGSASGTGPESYRVGPRARGAKTKKAERIPSRKCKRSQKSIYDISSSSADEAESIEDT